MSAARSSSSSDRFAKAASSRRKKTETEAPPERGRTAVRSKPYRTTVDLSPADHRRLRRLADKLADDLDTGEIPRRSIWLALLAELDDDDALYERVRDRIAESE